MTKVARRSRRHGPGNHRWPRPLQGPFGSGFLGCHGPAAQLRAAQGWLLGGHLASGMQLTPFAMQSADWWSVGVLLFEMLSGNAPFRAKNRGVLQKKILTEKIKYPTFLTSAAHKFLTALLQRDEVRTGLRAVLLLPALTLCAAVEAPWQWSHRLRGCAEARVLQAHQLAQARAAGGAPGSALASRSGTERACSRRRSSHRSSRP